jgi:putative phosphoesterase
MTARRRLYPTAAEVRRVRQRAHQVVGVIADTHGLMRPEALMALRDCDCIVHAGDIGSAAVLSALESIAPLFAIRGNNDGGAWAQALPTERVVDVYRHRIHLIHALADLKGDPASAGVSAVISGHSHRTQLDYRGGVLYLNPGSAGPRRFRLPITLALLYVDGDAIQPKLFDLTV